MAKTPPGPIAIVAPAHPSLTQGGAEIAAYALFEGLRTLGQSAIFIAACPLADRARFRPASRDEYALFTDPARYDDFYTIAATDNAVRLLAILTERGASRVNFHHHIAIGLNSFRAVAAAGIPFHVTFHDFTAMCAHQGQMITRPTARLCERATQAACAACFPERDPRQFTLRADYMRQVLLAARGYISPSHFVAGRYVEWGLPAAKFAIIENGLRSLPARPAPPRPHKRGQPYVFGTFGRVNASKGIGTVLDALELIAEQPALARRIRIRIHGTLAEPDGAFAARVAAGVAAHEFAEYAGAYRNDDVFDLMAKCDYVLVPSLWWENSPVVIQEAYACGRPVLCTGIGGMAEKVAPARHFRRGDPADLVRALSEATLQTDIPMAVGATDMAQSYLGIFG